jgi:CDP-diacylglycerol--glycerol-3-phosphate 3-phosphatidyltransferase
MTDEAITVDRGRRRVNWPNLITWVRILGSPGLIVLALLGQPFWFVAWAVGLVVTEWLDGFLARGWLSQSASGARLDTIADLFFYSSLLAAVFVLSPHLIGRELIWIASAIVSYACSWLASWLKFRRLPSYHTWAAKGAWIVVGAGIACLLMESSVWPFRMAMVWVVFTNVEAVAITLVLAVSRVDVPSVWHALRMNAATHNS